MLKGRNLTTTDDFTCEELLEVIEFAQEIEKSPTAFSDLCKGKLMGTLFFEPSTRTRLSFEAAMQRLGGTVIGFSEAASSSTAKGESLVDTIRIVGQYADIIVMRHPKEGAAELAANITSVPLINAGDGGHHHPTQTLADIMTIVETKGTLEHMKIGVCGDLQFGRTVHSLLKTMTRFAGNEYVLISPEELKVPEYIKKLVLDGQNIPYREEERLENVIGDLDILYMTRVQKERFFNEADYVRLKDSYILDNAKMKMAKKDLAVLHPLPRVNEIAQEVDDDPRALYFKQAHYGMVARMSLISKLLGVA